MTFKVLYNLFASHPESMWIIQPPNALSLYEFVKKTPIKRVLDLGTGIGASSSIIALALKEKGADFHIDTVEQSDKCIKLANELIPQELKDHITIHKSNVVIWNTDQIPYQNFSVYETLPEGDYDLILNDGPSPWVENDRWIELNNATIIKMLDRIKVGTYIAWDGRINALKVVERFFSDTFYLIPTGNRDFNILQRKDTVVFKDKIYDKMLKSSYFHDENKITAP